MTFDSEGRLYFGAISNSSLFETDGNALYSWKADGTSSSVDASLVAQDDFDLHWVDTFAFDNENQKLIFTPNRLDLFFNDNDRYWSSTLNTPENPNIQVVSVSIGASTYLAPQVPWPSPSPTPTTTPGGGGSNTGIIVGIVIAVIV